MVVLAVGCASDAECPDGYVLDSTCVPVTPTSDAGGDGDGDDEPDAADADAADAMGAVCEAEPEFEGGFESPCMDAQNHSECTCEADYCALMPGLPEGFCTVTGCVDDPDVCPAGWECFDLSAFVPGLNFCNPP